MKHTDLYLRLESFRDLEENWDGYGANPPCLISMELAKSALDSIFKHEWNKKIDILFICPSNDGNISFEIEVNWETGLKGLMFEVGPHSGSEDFYIYEEVAPYNPKTRTYAETCWDKECLWKDYSLPQIFNWLLEKEHTCTGGKTI